MSEKRKTTKGYWNKRWNKESFNRVIKYVAINRRLDLLFKKVLEPGDKRILDIGCAPGKWIVYFNQEFGYEVYGVDYSEVGCKITKETLRENGVRGRIICEDIFNTSFQNEYEGYFDIVYSMGVVEHFTDPTDVIDAHLKLLKNGGVIIITMPNFGNGSLYRLLLKILKNEEKLLKMHNTMLMKIQNFEKYLEKFPNLKIRMLNYFGPINLAAVSWPFGDSWVMYILHALNQVIGYPTLFIDSEIFSSFIVLVARKTR